MTANYLTTHVLDTSQGRPASGVEIALFRIDGDARVRLTKATTNADGRTDTPILSAASFELGTYELVFDVRRYYEQSGLQSPFLDTVPIRFTITERAHFHVPLLVSPFGYSTYRGS